MKTKKQLRCDDTLKLLTSKGRAVFFTLTTADEVEFDEIRRRWRSLRHDLVQDIRRRTGRRPLFVMNFERHPGYLQKVVKDDATVERVIRSDGRPHGWHIHGVIDCYLDLRRYRSFFDRAGFGRVDVRRVTSKGVADYLTKHALKAYRGLSRLARAKMQCQRMRLVNVSRGLPALAMYRWESEHLERTRRIFSELVSEHDADYGKIVNPMKYWKLAEVFGMLRVRTRWEFCRIIERIQRGETLSFVDSS